jgi:hypothetical protein
MQCNPFLDPILGDEALTRGLGDAEARVLVEWLVERAEELAQNADTEDAGRTMGHLFRRARGISHFVRLWCLEQDPGAAGQLAVTERFLWPWPEPGADACEVMQGIVTWETAYLDEEQLRAAERAQVSRASLDTSATPPAAAS